MSKPALTYFPLEPGRAFSIRAALRYAKFDYVDNRVGPKDFMTKYKANPEKSPFGSLPVLELHGYGSIGKFNS